jgi:hypothetical protein
LGRSRTCWYAKGASVSSSNAATTPFRAAIDPGYRGEIKVPLINHGQSDFTIDGEKVTVTKALDLELYWKDGRLTRYPELDGQMIVALLEDREGTLWAGSLARRSVGRLCAVQSGKTECHGEDGLYVGDQVVLQPVMSLWMTELAAVKGGQACCVEPPKGR